MMKRPVLVALAAAALLAACTEKRTVYRDGPRYSVRDNDDVFRRRGAVCDDDNNICYKNGKANRDITRDVFGRKAARRGPWD